MASMLRVLGGWLVVVRIFGVGEILICLKVKKNDFRENSEFDFVSIS